MNRAPDGQKSNDQFLLCSRTIDLPHLSSTEHMIHSKAVNSLGTTQLSGDLKEDQEKHELYSINESPIDAGDTGPLIDGKKEDSCTELTESTQIDVTKNSHQIEVFEWNPDEFSEDSMNCRESSSNSADVRGQENGVAKKDEEKNSGKKKDASPVEFKRVSDAREVPVVSISPRKPAKKSGKYRFQLFLYMHTYSRGHNYRHTLGMIISGNDSHTFVHSLTLVYLAMQLDRKCVNIYGPYCVYVRTYIHTYTHTHTVLYIQEYCLCSRTSYNSEAIVPSGYCEQILLCAAVWPS